MKDNIFLVLADSRGEDRGDVRCEVGDAQFIAWLGDVTAELQKPAADAQTGMAREITRTIEDIIGFVSWLRAGLGELADAIKGTGFDEWAKEFGYVRLAAIGLASFLSLGFLSAVIGLFGPLATLTLSLGRMVALSSVFLISNPIAAAILAIALAAALLYFHWDRVVSFMKDTWAEIKDVFSGVSDPFGSRANWKGPGSTGMGAGGEGGGGGGFLGWLRDPFGTRANAAGAGGGLAGPAGADVNVGGEVRVRFDGLPRGATVDVSSDNPAVPLDVQSGYILAPG